METTNLMRFILLVDDLVLDVGDQLFNLFDAAFNLLGLRVLHLNHDTVQYLAVFFDLLKINLDFLRKKESDHDLEIGT